MTVIATDGKTVASDSLITFGYERGAAASQKIFVEGGLVFATSGIALGQAIVRWYLNGADPSATPRVGDENWGLLVMDGSDILHFHAKNPYPIKVGAPFSMGSGGEYALGAMHHGASPEEAAAIAIKLCTTCGGEIQSVDIAEATGKSAKLRVVE